MKNQRLAYACTVFLGATLLFLVQPIVARTMLPAFGGSAGVWTTSMLYFQAVLLAGYLYSHLLTRFLSSRAQSIVHIGLLALSVTVLRFGAAAAGDGGHHPLLRVLGLLQVSIGIPYFVLSTTSPLMQTWYARTGRGVVPYRLFALSNAASLFALVSYPLVWETLLTLRIQTTVWSVAYYAFAVLAAWSAWQARASQRCEQRVEAAERAPWRRAALWVVLAFCPSVLWLGVANHLSQSVAAIPFLWVLPLSIYLLSFVISFENDAWYRPRVFQWLLPVAWVGMLASLFADVITFNFKLIIAINAVSLLIISTFCHGELARRKPGPARLTEFYLWVALGGALGSLFVAVIAPVIFRQYLELPLALALAVLLGAVLVFGLRSRAMLVRAGVTMGAAVAVALSMHPGTVGNRVEARNFYGALRVQDEGSVETACRLLYNGTVLHGLQWLSPARSRWTTAYYGTDSGVGRLLAGGNRAPMRVGVVGLGVGTVAAYAEAGDTFRFYEINPLVIRVARSNFRYLSECRGRVELVEGDARIQLEGEPAERFDVLVIDAFTGDSIPVHLLTEEAFRVYERHLAQGGAIAVHVSNKYLDLSSLVAATARSLGQEAILVASAADVMRRTSSARWVVTGDAGGLIERVRSYGHPAPLNGSVKVWTDDFHNIFEVLQ